MIPIKARFTASNVWLSYGYHAYIGYWALLDLSVFVIEHLGNLTPGFIRVSRRNKTGWGGGTIYASADPGPRYPGVDLQVPQIGHVNHLGSLAQLWMPFS